MILKSKKLNLMVVCYENRNHQNLLVRFLEAECWIVEEKCQIESLTTRNVFVCIVIHIYVNYQTCEVYNCPIKCYSECSCSNCIWQTYLEGFLTISGKECCELYTHKTILNIMVDCLKTPASLLRHSLRNKNANESLYSTEREYSISATVANKIKVKCVYPYFEGKKHIMQHIQSVGDNSEHRKHDKLLPSDVDHNCNEKTESSQHLWQRRDSFSSCSSDSAVYCSSRHTQMKGSMPDAFSKLSYESSRSKGSCDNKRQRHSSGSSMISVASDSSNKETHSTSTVTDIVADFQVPSQFDKNNMQIGGQNLRLVTRIEASQSSVASKSNQNVRSSKSKLHTVVTEEAYICKPAEQPPQYTTHSYHDLRRNIRRKIACSHGDCKHDNHTTFIFRRYTEIQHATRPSVFSTQGSSQHRNVSPESHRSSLVSNPNSSKRPRKSEIDRLYDSLHEIKWAKHFSPENILKQNEYRRTASQISFNKEKDRNSGLLKAHCSPSAGNKLLTLKSSDISKNRISLKKNCSRENFLKNLKNTQNSKKCFTPLNSGANITLGKRRDGNRFCTRSSQSRYISKNLAQTSRVTQRNILREKEKPVSKTHLRRQTRSSTNPVPEAANLTPHQSSIVNRKSIILRSDSAKGNVECKEKTFDVCLDNVNIKKEKVANSEFVNSINETNEISTKFKLNMDSSDTQSQTSHIKDPIISIVANVNSDASCSFSQSSRIPEIVPVMSEMPLQNNRAEKLLERNLNTTDNFNDVNYLKSASQEIVLPERSLPENISIQFCYTSKSEALTSLAKSHSPHKSQCDVSENFEQNDVVELVSKDESILDNNYLCLKAEDSFSHSESSDLPVLSTENSPVKVNDNFCDMPPVLEPCLLLPNQNRKATSQQSITSVELTEVGNSYPEYSSEIFGGHESGKANFSRNNTLSEAVYKTELDMPSEEFKCKPFKDSDVESLEMHDSLLQSVHINNALEVSSKASDPNVLKSDKLRCLERKSLTHPVNLRTHNTCKLIIKKYVKGVTKKVKLKRMAENASWNSTSTCDRMQNTTVINKKFQNCDCHRETDYCNCFNSACTKTQRVTTSVNNRFNEADNTRKYISNRNINLSRTYFKYGKYKVGENSWQTTSSNNSATNFDIPSYSNEKRTLCKPLHSDSLQVERFKGATSSKNISYRKIPRIGYTADKDSKRNPAEDRQLTVFQPHALPSASKHSEKKSDCDEKALRSKISYYGFTFHYKGITVNKNDSYTQVILKLSSSRNIFLSVEALAELKDTLNSAVNDANCQVLIVNGTGNSFCSGLDLKPLIGPRKKDASKEMAVAVKEFIEALASFHKPLVSVVNGSAVGLGVTLLTYSDVVLASDTATFHMPYTQLGYMPEGAGTLTLPQVVGATVAMDMLLRGRMITARQALDYGLVSEVLEANMLPQQLVSRVRVLAENPVTAMETTKSMLRWHLLEKLHVALDNELQMLPKQWLSPTCQMALKKAFQNGLLGD